MDNSNWPNQCANIIAQDKCSQPWAAQKCPKTCGVCNPNPICQDNGNWPNQCENILGQGKCSQPWAAKICPETCGLCSNNGMIY